MVFAWARLISMLVESQFNLTLAMPASLSVRQLFPGRRTPVLWSADSSSLVSGLEFSSQRTRVLQSAEFCSPVSGILFPGQRNFVPWSEKTFFLVREIIFSSQRKKWGRATPVIGELYLPFRLSKLNSLPRLSVRSSARSSN